MLQLQKGTLRCTSSTTKHITLLKRFCTTSASLSLNQRQLAQKRRAKMVGIITDHYVFGSCEQGQLGLGEMEELVLAPKKIDALEGLNVRKIVIGHNHSFALLKENKLMGWGYNKNGQLGLGHNNHVSTPTELPAIEGHKILDVTCGPLQTWVITENEKTGKQAIWHTGSGYAESGEIKWATTRSELAKVKKSSFLGTTKIVKIIPGADFCLWIDENGKIYSFGVNLVDTWQLGQGYDTNTELIPLPTPIPGLEGIKIKDAAIGWGHTIALTEDNRVFSWGSNLHGQCGLGHSTSPVRAPKEIELLRGVHIDQVACGETHSLVLDSQGGVWAWGSHAEGKLGLGDNVNNDVLSPTKISALDEADIIGISCGTDHSAALSKNGQFYVWGFGQHGALSFQSFFRNLKTPMEISLPSFRPRKEGEEDDEDTQDTQQETQIPPQPTEAEISEKIKSGELKQIKVQLVPGTDEGAEKEEEKDFLVTPEQEEMFARMEQLPRPRVPIPDPRGYPIEHEDYPFIIEGQKVTEGEFFDRKYTHLPVLVQCGMDSTVITLVSTPARE